MKIKLMGEILDTDAMNRAQLEYYLMIKQPCVVFDRENSTEELRAWVEAHAEENQDPADLE